MERNLKKNRKHEQTDTGIESPEQDPTVAPSMEMDELEVDASTCSLILYMKLKLVRYVLPFILTFKKKPFYEGHTIIVID
jgi:hypothetical protein